VNKFHSTDPSKFRCMHKFQQKLSLLAFLVYGSCTPCFGAQLQTQWSYKQAEEFQRISEFFTGKENLGNRIVLRSIPENRNGLYFSVYIKSKIRSLPSGTKAVVEVLQPNSPDTQTYEFMLPEVSSKSKELMLGVTGDNWPNEDDHPLAWRVQLIDAEGKLIASDHSYLWR